MKLEKIVGEMEEYIRTRAEQVEDIEDKIRQYTDELKEGIKDRNDI